nr:unnamed protein product [Callosobruchus chinensis]
MREVITEGIDDDTEIVLRAGAPEKADLDQEAFLVEGRIAVDLHLIHRNKTELLQLQKKPQRENKYYKNGGRIMLLQLRRSQINWKS